MDSFFFVGRRILHLVGLLDYPDRLTASKLGGLSGSPVLDCCLTLVVGYFRTGASAPALYAREHNDRRYLGGQANVRRDLVERSVRGYAG